jgi:hypothetical protein
MVKPRAASTEAIVHAPFNRRVHYRFRCLHAHQQGYFMRVLTPGEIDMPKRTDVATLEWSLSLMGRLFRDLTVSFATFDAAGADMAAYEIEAAMATELAPFRNKSPEGIKPNLRLRHAGTPLRAMMQDASDLIQHGGKSKQIREMDGYMIAIRWRLILVARAFRDLAASFGAVDGKRADRAVGEIEATIVREMLAFREKPPEGIVVDIVVLAKAITPLRAMTRDARALIQQGGKPKH